jgi:hypothetical protein
MDEPIAQELRELGGGMELDFRGPWGRLCFNYLQVHQQAA